MTLYLCMWSQIHNRAVKKIGEDYWEIFLLAFSFSNPAIESELETCVFSWSVQFPCTADPEDIVIRSIEQFERNMTFLFHDSFLSLHDMLYLTKKWNLIYINSTSLNVFRLVQVLRCSFPSGCMALMCKFVFYPS